MNIIKPKIIRKIKTRKLRVFCADSSFSKKNDIE